MTMLRRGLLALPGIALGTARAAGFPDQPLRLVVPFAAGGPADFIARIVGRGLGDRLGQPVVIDTRAGAGGMIGVDAVAKARPDGYSLVLGSSGAMAVQPHMQQRMPFDPLRDLAPVGLVLAVPQLVAVAPGLPADSIAALVALAKARPGQLSYGSSGIGGSLHMAAELFRQSAGIEITHIPFRGAAPAVTELLAGRIDILLADVPALLTHVQSGALRVLAVTAAARLAMLPAVPTMSEAGQPAVLSETWYGVFAPAGTPAERIALLSTALAATLAAPETRQRLEEQGGSLGSGTPDELATHHRADYARWGAVIRAAGIRLD